MLDIPPVDGDGGNGPAPGPSSGLGSGSVPGPGPGSGPGHHGENIAAVSSQRPSIDDMIQRLAQEQDQRIAHDRRPSESGEPQAGPSGVRERRESNNSGLRAGGERRASSAGPTSDHSYAVATQHDPLSPRASEFLIV